MKKIFALIPFLLLFLSAAQSQNCQAFLWPTDWTNGSTTLTAFDSASTGVIGYQWSNGETTQSITTSVPGTYCVVVTFEGGCTASDCYDLPEECWVTGWWYWLDDQSAYVTAWGGPTYLDGTYLWSNGATTQGITVTTGGQYCVTVTKENGCTATTCMDVPAISDCSVYIETWSWPDSTIQLHASTNASNAQYLWNTGETNSVITLSGPGFYSVTITTPDGCMASDSAYMSSPNCYVYVYPQWSPDSILTSMQALAGINPVAYLWDNGATTQSVPVDGSESYCVTVTTANGCTASDCYDIPTSNYLAVWVQIPDSLNGVEAEVYLIEYDTAQGGILTAVDTFLTDSGGFLLIEQPAGEYLIKAALVPGFPYYDDYLPTYYEQSLFWDEATPVTILPAFPWNFGTSLAISLVAGQNPGGPGFIGGLVSQGANFTSSGDQARGEGDPMAGVQIILRKEDDTPVSATRTAADGTYSFGSLAWGTYRVSIDLPGITPVHQLVTIGPDAPSAANVGFTVNGLGSTAAVEIGKAPKLLASPNPVHDVLTVQLPSNGGQLTLTNTQGQVVQQLMERSAQARFDVHSLPEGIYLLTLRTDNQSVTTKIVKR